jgi:predicted dehydrogenase
MGNLSNVGAAVIGSGFIGTVHIEALRRIGVRVVGLVEATPELGAARAAELGLAMAYPTLAGALADDDVQVVHVTSPNELHHRQVKEILAAGRHVICEKPLAMTSAESAELAQLAAAGGLVNAVNFNIRFYPLNQHVAGLVREGGLGDVRLVTGRYFQDWLLYDTDWNWRLEKDKGGALRAVGDIGSHWLDLTTFLTGRRVEAVMADLTTFIPVRRKPAGPVLTFSTERAAETVPVEIDTEDVATILLRFEGGARQRGDLPAQPGPQERPRLPDRRRLLSRGVGLGAARAALDRSSRQAERAPAPKPCPHERGRADGRPPARRARRRLRRHVRRSLRRDLRGHRGRDAVPRTRLRDLRRRS